LRRRNFIAEANRQNDYRISLGADESGAKRMKTTGLDTMIAPRADATPYSQRFLAALDAGGSWSREAYALLETAARLGLRLDENLLTWSDVRDLQAIRLFLTVRYYRQLRSETQN
jgi:hypothetical protein